MPPLLEFLGEILDKILGESVTTEHHSNSADRSMTLRPDLAEPDVELGVRLTKITYITTYQRWWVPNVIRSVYQVVAFAPPALKVTLNPLLFELCVYPRLSNRLLENTRYPYLYALHAFCERMGPLYPTITCEL